MPNKIFYIVLALAMVCAFAIISKSFLAEQAKKQARIEYLKQNCKIFMEQNENSYTKVWYNCNDKTVTNIEFR